MRLLPALVALLIAAPSVAATIPDDEAMATPCRTYLAAEGTAIYGALLDAIVTRLSASPQSSRFGSACNMGDYVRAVCRQRPDDDLRRALDRLERLGAAGRLPTIFKCGA